MVRHKKLSMENSARDCSPLWRARCQFSHYGALDGELIFRNKQPIRCCVSSLGDDQLLTIVASPDCRTSLFEDVCRLEDIKLRSPAARELCLCDAKRLLLPADIGPCNSDELLCCADNVRRSGVSCSHETDIASA